MQGDLADRLIDLPEAVAALGVSPRTVERLAERGFLSRVKLFGSTRYRASEVEQLIREGTRGRTRRVA